MPTSDWQTFVSRRTLIASGCGVLCATTLSPDLSIASSTSEPIPQPAEPNQQAFVDRAFAMRDLALAEGDQGYGAVIVDISNSKIVGQAPSRVATNTDPTAHAEIEAIRDAARRLGNRDLSNHIMVSSSRPCPMCEAAAFWARLDGMIYGPDARDAGRPKLCRG